MTENEEKLKFVNLQMVAIIGFILALIISFLLAYNKKLSLENKKTIFSNKEAQDLAEFQSTLVVIISFVFFYVNYGQFKVAKKYNNPDANEIFIQELTSVLSILVATIGLIITFSHRKGALTISQVNVL